MKKGFDVHERDTFSMNSFARRLFYKEAKCNSEMSYTWNQVTCLHTCCHPIQMTWGFIWKGTTVKYAHATDCTEYV